MVASSGRTRRFTPAEVNAKLQTEAEARVAYYARHPDQIERRLRELDAEWDIERAVETEAGTTVLAGFILGMTLSRKWYLLSVLAGSMLLLHNLYGNYPLLSVYRRLGFRTPEEIAQERYALKALRGDFRRLAETQGEARTTEAFNAAQPDGDTREESLMPII